MGGDCIMLGIVRSVLKNKCKISFILFSQEQLRQKSEQAVTKNIMKYLIFCLLLPESLQIEWIFIGSGGKGADMHVRYILFMGKPV